MTVPFETWLYPTDRGLYCEPGGFHIDPHLPVDRAVISHGHSDHARPGHTHVLATPPTADIIAARLGPHGVGRVERLAYGRELRIGDVAVRLIPAGHILGSAQIAIDYKGQRAVVSGDYKRANDPTCDGFEVVPCDLFVTEATFGLPVFRHECAAGEIQKLLASLQTFPDRTHLVGVYALGKCQRVIALLRAAGYDRTIFVHGALESMCGIYERHGVGLGPIESVGDKKGGSLAGEIVLCPPGAIKDRWSRRMAEPVTAVASGWMRVRARARQRGAELPLVISDHADWPELIATIEETGAGEVWVTHGREDALVHQITAMGRRGRALALVGREEDGE